MHSIETKLKDESRHDFLFALQALRDKHQFLASMKKLSGGHVPNGEEAAKFFGGDDMSQKLSKFAALLCGLRNWKGADCPRLQSPYAECCFDFISVEAGRCTVNVSRTGTEAAGITVTLIDRFKSSLTLFGQCHKLFYKDEAQLISESVVDVLLQADIGIASADGKSLEPVRSMFDHPLLQQLYENSTTGYEHVYTQHLKQYKKWKKGGCHDLPPNSELLGFQILKALRNVVSDNSDISDTFTLLGLRPSVLDSIVCAFEKRALETLWGFFYSANNKCFKLRQEMLDQAEKPGSPDNNSKPRPQAVQQRVNLEPTSSVPDENRVSLFLVLSRFA
jgi:hypothetical protein